MQARGLFARVVAIAILALLAGCAPPPPRVYPPAPPGSRGATGAIISPEVAPAPAPANSFSRDAQECEREAAISGVAGAKAEVFNRCMRARGHTAR